jgi:uncharacterized protein
MFEAPLSPVELRVLGSLIEKELSTPEYYPLTLNALVNACNQSTNRDPVLALDEGTVSGALDDLRDAQVVYLLTGSRVPKYGERVLEALGLSVQEAAILAELLLRGPQTQGELRNRCGRMYPFADHQEAETVLELMAGAEHPLVAALPRTPGTKEIRYAHTLGDPADSPSVSPSTEVVQTPSRLERLEGEVAALRQELAEVREAFEAFKAQF